MAIKAPLEECRARRCGWKIQNTVRESERQCRKTMDGGALSTKLAHSEVRFLPYLGGSDCPTGLIGIPMEGGLGGAESNLSRAVLASTKTRSDMFSTRPKRRKGIAVAATRSLALLGTLASGSQRKSCAERKKVRHAHRARERIST